ncbi:DUF916 and DUF3324 domain-containing protein [Companilactobacillus mishanensis]|uniref:DUF916 and DUF3324 domain-containing protein n=1 Tax=Companilactobacillus mishanensis TaxID=2486008 RepID=A0ABW9P3J1_9LACO|nr:DUF916 and DUF3324 domain-containing protein [Companilactobacillus mishanensis]MQS43870.1 DUF916 and DUF3324 domain-containing protein [Companilactobacillus mishanensis]
MKKFLTLLFCSMFALAGFLGFNSSTVKADAVKYTVSAEIPNNQVNKKLTYFDLKVAPNSTQDLKIKIINNDSVEHTYDVAVNRASTNVNGLVDYSQHGTKKDPSLKYDIESMFPAPERITIPANTTKEVTLTLKVPNQKFSGVLLGGIRVLQEINNQKPSKKEFSVNNQFAYVIGLKLQQSTDEVKPDMKLTNVKAEQNNGQNNITADLQNDEPTLMDDVNVDATVTPENGTKSVLKVDKKNMSMAPNSNFAMPVSLNNQPLKAGKYTMHISANAEKGTDKWNMKRNFTVTPKAAAKLNTTAVGQASQPNYNLIIALIVAAALIVIGLLIWNFKNQRRRR